MTLDAVSEAVEINCKDLKNPPHTNHVFELRGRDNTLRLAAETDEFKQKWIDGVRVLAERIQRFYARARDSGLGALASQREITVKLSNGSTVQVWTLCSRSAAPRIRN